MKRVTTVIVRTADRGVQSWQTTDYAPHHLDEDGTPTIQLGADAPEGCVVEGVTPEVLAAIQAAMPDHGAGVALSADHATITPLPPTEAYLADQAIVAQQRAEDAALVEALVNVLPANAVQALARRLGLT